MLADDIQNPKNQIQTSFDENLSRTDIASSHRFVLDDEATRLCVNISTAGPQDIARLLPLARVPFDKVWIEVPRNTKMEQQFKLGTMPQLPNPTDSNCMIGYYVERISDTRWSVLVSEHDVAYGPPTYITWPVGFVVETNGQLRLDSNPYYETDSTALLWGYHHDNPNISSLVNTAGLHVADPILSRFSQGTREYPAGTDLDEIFTDMVRINGANPNLVSILKELSGTVRFITAVLSTITCVPVEYVDVQPKGMRLVNRKPKPYMRYSLTKLMLPRRVPKNITKWAHKFIHAEARRIRRHSVKGHWRNLRSGKMIWVHEHERGDARIGYVSKITQVTARNDHI